MASRERERSRAGRRDLGDNLGRGPHGPVPPGDAEDEYWRSNWRARPYTDRTRDYDHYRPAFRLGWEAKRRYPDQRWEEIEEHLAGEWGRQRPRDRGALKWDEARLAARDAWRRAEPEASAWRQVDRR